MILKYLPKNIIFVLLTDECRERLKYAIKNSFGTIRNISRILNMNENYFSRWLNGDRYIPLNILIQLHSLSKKKGFDIDFENYIKEYRLSRGGTVKNPKFPINEVALANVYMHLIGDGYVSKKQVPEYHNSDKGVREEFKEAVRCFGEVSITEKEDSIYIPTLIAEILKHRYKIDVFGSHDAKIPQIFFDFPKEIIASGIRAFADDEAAVSDTNIRFYSSNRSLLKQLRELIICKFSKDIKNGIPFESIRNIGVFILISLRKASNHIEN
jgi:hypothetical protein